jgi:G:T-mismatch repair DNA endonuclease (very short patch repair protein)
VRSFHRAGLRFRLHGCFWHRHNGCKDASTLGTRTEFWQKKFNGNVERDKKVSLLLEALGWKVLVIWECDIFKNADTIVPRVFQELNLHSKEYLTDVPETILKVAAPLIDKII